MRRACRYGWCAVLSLALILTFRAPGHADWEMDHADYEEPAGASFAFLLNPADDIYGISVGSGVWLRGTPVFGDYFIRLYHSGIEDTVYSGIGMTFRLMPHWRLAPFIGVGGSYDYSLSNPGETNTVGSAGVGVGTMAEPIDRGDSFWAGHVESGVRLWLANRVGLLEVFGRFTWTSFEEDDRDFWLMGIGTGMGF